MGAKFNPWAFKSKEEREKIWTEAPDWLLTEMEETFTKALVDGIWTGKGNDVAIEDRDFIRKERARRLKTNTHNL